MITQMELFVIPINIFHVDYNDYFILKLQN